MNFSLAADEIQAIAERDGKFWIQLVPPAASRLTTVTTQSYGKQLAIEIDGMPVLHTYMHATIESGVIQVDQPSSDIRVRLESLRKR